jgi:multiple sugar transport system substrate-binding protein
MRKLIKSMLWLCTLVMLASACGPSDEEIEELLENPVDEVVTVRWLVVGEGSEPWNRSAINDFVANFNRSQENIILELVTGSGFGGLNDQLEAGNQIDIVGPMSPNFGTRFNDIWTDIESQVMEGSSLDRFDPAALDAWRRQGKLVGVPFGFWPAVLFFNKDIFDKAGLAYPPQQYGVDYAGGGAWSLDTVAEIAPVLTLDRYGQTARNPSFDPDAAVQWGFTMGGEDLRAAVAIFGTAGIQSAGGEVRLPQAWRDASHWLHEAIWEGKYFPNLRGFEATRGDPFGKGQAAMFYAPTWYLCCEVDFNYDFAAVPSFDGKITSRRDHAGFGIPLSSQYQEAAMQVILEMVTDPGLIASFRIVPARTDLRNDLAALMEEKNPEPDWQVMVDSLAYPDDPPYSQFLPSASGVFNRFGSFAESLMMQEDLDVDAALDSLETDLQGILAGE